MRLFQEIKTLLVKELMSEWKQRYTLNGIFMFVISTVFAVFLSVQVWNQASWNALFWIILLFSAVTATARSFLQESKGRLLYYYQLFSARGLLLGKMVYNTLIMLAVTLLCFFTYVIMMGNEAPDTGTYLLTLCLGSLVFAAILTVTSAIASQAGNGHILMPVLSFPLLIPMLLVAIKTSTSALQDQSLAELLPHYAILFLFYLLVGLLGVILFPFLARN